MSDFRTTMQTLANLTDLPAGTYTAATPAVPDETVTVVVT